MYTFVRILWLLFGGLIITVVGMSVSILLIMSLILPRADSDNVRTVLGIFQYPRSAQAPIEGGMVAIVVFAVGSFLLHLRRLGRAMRRSRLGLKQFAMLPLAEQRSVANRASKKE